jgi:hypothetical protein
MYFQGSALHPPGNDPNHMSSFLMRNLVPILLRDDLRESAAGLRARQVIPLIVLCGGVYGGVMGSFAGHGSIRWMQILFSAVKVPMLLGVSFVLAVPSFFILSSLLGLRDDFLSAIRALASAQAGLAITLASLSPFVALWYASCADYGWAILQIADRSQHPASKDGPHLGDHLRVHRHPDGLGAAAVRGWAG